MPENGSTTAPRVLTLIPEESFIVFFDETAVPGSDAQSELRMMAYQRQDTPVLGADIGVQEAVTLMQAAAQAAAASAGTAAFPALRRYAARLRGRRAAPLSEGEARTVAARAAEHAGIPADVSASPVEPQPGGGWQITVRHDGRTAEFRIEGTGAWTEIDIRPL